MSSLTLTDAVSRYLDVRTCTSRPNTVENYRFILKHWLRFLSTHHPGIRTIEKLERSHFEHWLRSLAMRRPPFKNSTRRLSIIRCRRFLCDISEWAWTSAPLEDLLRTSDLPPLNRQLPKPLSAELDALIQHALKTQDNLWAKGLLLARWTGLRIGELTRLERQCLIAEPGERWSIRVPLGKLHNERLIPVDPQTAQLVEGIRHECGRRPATIDPDTGQQIKLLICAPDGSRLTEGRFRYRLNRIVLTLGIPEHVHPHRFRHTYATELLRHGMSLPGVMRLLGHSTPTMTLRYAGINQDDLRESYLRAIREARKRYPHVTKIIDHNSQTDPSDTLDDLDGAFCDVVARIQAIRFNHPDSEKKKKLQRFVESLRRAQKKLPDLLS